MEESRNLGVSAKQYEKREKTPKRVSREPGRSSVTLGAAFLLVHQRGLTLQSRVPRIHPLNLPPPSPAAPTCRDTGAPAEPALPPEDSAWPALLPFFQRPFVDLFEGCRFWTLLAQHRCNADQSAATLNQSVSALTGCTCRSISETFPDRLVTSKS
jgi:hypothetical protein